MLMLIINTLTTLSSLSGVYTTIWGTLSIFLTDFVPYLGHWSLFPISKLKKHKNVIEPELIKKLAIIQLTVYIFIIILIIILHGGASMYKLGHSLCFVDIVISTHGNTTSRFIFQYACNRALLVVGHSACHRSCNWTASRSHVSWGYFCWSINNKGTHFLWIVYLRLPEDGHPSPVWITSPFL